jgi:glutamine synthetase
VEVAPRQILRRQVERARAAGYSFKFGSELEFFMFRDSYEEAWRRRYESLEPSAHYRADYHMLQTTKVEEVIGQIRAGMNGAGVPVFGSKGEWGLGQHEINLRYADPLEMADRHAIYKNGAKEIAALNGLSITFMAKWAIEEIGSSFHVHSSLWDADGSTPLLWEAAAPHHLSPTARHYLGGILAGAREMTYLFAPNVNSYKRFQPASFAPTTIAWGHDNRTCGFRLVGERRSLRIENRIPGADANPYLAFAATIASALHGLERGLEPPPICERNAYETPETGLVPGTLLESIDLFEGSRLARDAFGESVVKHLVNVARQELAIFNHQTITDWERRRYFERA